MAKLQSNPPLMKKIVNILFLLSALVFTSSCTHSNAYNTALTAQAGEYRCTPCGYDCDKQVFIQPGKCPHCQMDLVKASTIGKSRSIKPSDICSYIEKHPCLTLFYWMSGPKKNLKERAILILAV